MLTDDKSLQRFLAGKGTYRGAIDGLWGAGSDKAARSLLSSLGNAACSYQPGWDTERVKVAVTQAMFESIGQDLGRIDGIAGPRTMVALERWQDHITFDRGSPDPTAGVISSSVWPRQANCATFYGVPGTNHTRITPPYPIFYGDQRVESILINERCAESASRILEAVLAHYGAEKIHELGLDRFGGCFNNRAMRNGRALSTHAYACAWDWDPVRNPLRATAATAQMAKPEYAAFIDAHEAEGWISLGRARNFDWMHFQAARL